MNNKRKFIGVKDLILGVLLSCVVLVLFFVVSPILQPLGVHVSLVLTVVIPAIIGGSVFLLLINKSLRTGTFFVFCLPFALVFMITGTIATPIMYLLCGISGELIMLGRGWQAKWRGVIPYCLFWLVSSFGSLVSMLIMPESSVKAFMGMGMDQAAAQAMFDNSFATMSNPVFITVQAVSAVVAAILGYFIGTKILLKHFKGAGVA